MIRYFFDMIIVDCYCKRIKMIVQHLLFIMYSGYTNSNSWGLSTESSQLGAEKLADWAVPSRSTVVKECARYWLPMGVLHTHPSPRSCNIGTSWIWKSSFCLGLAASLQLSLLTKPDIVSTDRGKIIVQLEKNKVEWRRINLELWRNTLIIHRILIVLHLKINTHSFCVVINSISESIELLSRFSLNTKTKSLGYFFD